MKRAAFFLAASLGLLSARAQGPALEAAAGPASAPQAATSTDAPSFELRIDAPSDIAELLGRHLQLQRYREVRDLDASELDRLMALARQDAAELLATLGHHQPRIDLSRQALADGRPLVLLRVQAGPLTRVAEVQLRFEGDLAQSPDEDALALRAAIARDWALPAGQPLTQARWSAAKTQALRQLLARRYPTGRISQSLAEVDPATHSARLQLTLDSGPLFRVGPLQVSGLQRYDPVLVPRLARVSPGQVYDQRQLLEAQQRLSSSGYFDAAYLTLDTSGEPAAAPLQAQLREAKLQKVVLGLGLATDSGARLSLEHVHNRVPLLDWRAQSQLQLDAKSPFAQTEWTSLPDEGLWRWIASLRLDRQDDGTLLTDTQRWRAGRQQAGERIDRLFYLQYDRSRVQGEQAGSATGEGAALSLNQAWVRRDFDSLPTPRRGQALRAEIGVGSTLVGQHAPYVRALGRWTGVLPLGAGDDTMPNSRLALRLEAGAVGARRDAPVPAAQLFRTGGDTSVRGYGLRDIGVALPGGGIGPGRYLATGSVEWQRPLGRSSRLAGWESTLFVDAGEVSQRASELGGSPSVGVGTGLRWNSPIGPLQIDLAYGLKLEQWRLHLSVGWVF